MALGGAPNIGWDESSPADSESAALGNERIQSVKSSVRQGLDSEHYWSSSGGTAGAHRPGSAKPFVGLQSAVSSSDTDGRLMWTSDTSRLFHVGSSGKNYIGGARALSLGSTPAVTATHHWVEEVGQVTTNSSGTALVTIPNSGYSGMPFVFVNSAQTGYTFNLYVFAGAFQVDASSFIVFTAEDAASFSSGKVVHWRSLGTRVIA